MLLYSTDESVRQVEVTALAVTESIGAVAFSLLLYWHFNMLSHVAISAALAPVLLLRTPRSTELGLNLGYKVGRAVFRLMLHVQPVDSRTWTHLIYFIFYFLILNLLGALSLFAAKAGALSIAVVTHPIEAIGHIPENWRKVVLCIDTMTLPEVLPGTRDLAKDDVRIGLKQYTLEFWLDGVKGSWPLWMLATLFLLPIIIPALAYRWALKSTALIWSPFVWAFRPIRRDEDPVVFAKGILKLSIYKAARIYSALILIIFLGKIVFLLTGLKIASQQLQELQIIQSYFVPDKVPLWHLTAVASACLTWLIFLKAENYVHRVAHLAPVSHVAMTMFFKLSFVIRNLLSIYTSVCSLYITVKLAASIDMPLFYPIVFPW